MPVGPGGGPPSRQIWRRQGATPFSRRKRIGLRAQEGTIGHALEKQELHHKYTRKGTSWARERSQLRGKRDSWATE
jgi:hypothetical protein